MTTNLSPSRYRRAAFFVLVRILVFVLLGVNARRRALLPVKGPAIIVANHNSHLDTLVLISLMPLRLLPSIRPVAAADYFLKPGKRAWFAQRIIGIIPIQKGAASKHYDPLSLCCEALERGDILILFPEGTRGAPEQMAQFKKGVAHLAGRYPDVPVTPVFMHGLGKSLPKGDVILVPFFCDVFVGPALHYPGERQLFLQQLNDQFEALSHEKEFAVWE